MRKHDLLSLVFILLAGTGAALVYSGFVISGQIIFSIATFASVFQTKFIGAVVQAYTPLLLCAAFGGIIGDWWLSVAIVISYFAVNLRSFIFKEAIYTKGLIVEPVLIVVAIGIYAGINLFHHAGWQGWALPWVALLQGVIVPVFTYPDRIKVKRMLEMGVIETGTEAPDFTLINYDGKKISLSDYKDKRDVLLIFVRGDWCPGCHIMLRLYEREREKFQEKNVMLFAIGPDPVGVNLEMVKKLGVEFAVLSDETMEVSKKFCVRIQEDVPGAKYDPGIPLPASFLVDKKGIIRYTSRADRAGEFLRPDVIFDVLAKI